MSTLPESLEDYLSENGINGYYVWKPNQISVKDPSNPSNYIAINVAGGDSTEDIVQAAEDEAELQISLVDQAGASAISSINSYEDLYSRIKAITLTALNNLLDSFTSQNMLVQAAIVSNAVNQINGLSDPTNG